MLTLPDTSSPRGEDTLTPNQLRWIDVLVDEALYHRKVEWRWFRGHNEIWYRKSPKPRRGDILKPAYLDGSRWVVIPNYRAPGPANNEVAERMLPPRVQDGQRGSYDEPVTYANIHHRADGRFAFALMTPDDSYVGEAPTLPLAVLAAFLDWQGIGIPEAQP